MQNPQQHQNIRKAMDFILEYTAKLPSKSPYSQAQLSQDVKHHNTYVSRQSRDNRGARNYQSAQNNSSNSRRSGFTAFTAIDNEPEIEREMYLGDDEGHHNGATIHELHNEAEEVLFTGKCFECKQVGHFARDCHKSAGMRQTIQKGNTSSSNSSSANGRQVAKYEGNKFSKK